LHFVDFANEELKERESYYLQRYGLVPEFRIALHAGEVVSGEIGLLKKEIAYLGDVLNTTARLLESSRDLGSRLVCSDQIFPMVGSPEQFNLVGRGQLQLRGKQETIAVFVRP
tara:strand:+ start:9871 stop:10209 length:339 start_codon:yes stop_codon:yes gene_type:complete